MQTEGRICFSENSAIRSKYNRAETAGGAGVAATARGAGRRPDQPRPCAHCRKERCDATKFAPLSCLTLCVSRLSAPVREQAVAASRRAAPGSHRDALATN